MSHVLLFLSERWWVWWHEDRPFPFMRWIWVVILAQDLLMLTAIIFKSQWHLLPSHVAELIILLVWWLGDAEIVVQRPMNRYEAHIDGRPLLMRMALMTLWLVATEIIIHVLPY